MAQGDYGTETLPWSSLVGDKWVFTPMTSDPSSPETVGLWLREDLNSGDQIAEFRFWDGSDIKQAPVFPDSATPDDPIKKVLRVYIDGEGWGFVPVYEDGGALDEIAIWHDGARHGWHDSLDAIPDSGISRWTHDDADTSGSTSIDSWGSNDGTINGATTGVAGEFAEAYDFGGSADYVNVGQPADFDFGTGDFAISLWVNPDGTSATGERLFGADDGNDGIAVFWNADDEFEFRTRNGASIRISQANGPAFGSWNHVVAQRDGGTLELWVENTKQDTASDGGTDVDNNTDKYIGRIAGSDNNHFDGQIDHVDVYDAALTDAEIDNLYNTGSING